MGWIELHSLDGKNPITVNPKNITVFFAVERGCKGISTKIYLVGDTDYFVLVSEDYETVQELIQNATGEGIYK